MFNAKSCSEVIENLRYLRRDVSLQTSYSVNHRDLPLTGLHIGHAIQRDQMIPELFRGEQFHLVTASSIQREPLIDGRGQGQRWRSIWEHVRRTSGGCTRAYLLARTSSAFSLLRQCCSNVSFASYPKSAIILNFCIRLTCPSMILSKIFAVSCSTLFLCI